MSRLLTAGCVALLLAGLGGCGARTAEANLKQQIALMKEMTGQHDRATDVAEVDVDRAIRALQKLVKLQEDFKKFPEAEQKAAKTKYSKELKEVGLDDEKGDVAGGGKDDGKDDDDADDMHEKQTKDKSATKSKQADPVQPAPKKADAGKDEPKYSEE